jgi:hypothetical protein
MQTSNRVKPQLPKGMKWVGTPRWIHGPYRGNRKLSRSALKRVAALATNFLNLTGQTAEAFLAAHSHEMRQKLNARALIQLADGLRSAWLTNGKKRFIDTCNGIFAGGGLGHEIARTPSRWLVIEPCAFSMELNKKHPAFKPRDLLDSIAHCVAEAKRNRLLRTCEGHRRGWGCLTPRFVATERRQRYCSRCGREGKKRAKLLWWHSNRSPKRRQRAA